MPVCEETRFKSPRKCVQAVSLVPSRFRFRFPRKSVQT